MQAQGSIKRCPRCKEWKETTQFGLDRARKDQLQTYCRQCMTEMNRSRNRLKSDVEAELAQAQATIDWVGHFLPILLPVEQLEVVRKALLWAEGVVDFTANWPRAPLPKQGPRRVSDEELLSIVQPDPYTETKAQSEEPLD